jgi:hypothetical protein
VTRCSNEELVSNVYLNLKKTERLTEQLTTTIDSAFSAHDAAELVGIALDWMKHVDEDQVRETLCALLRECERTRIRAPAHAALGLFPRAARSLEDEGEFHTDCTETWLMRSDTVTL